MNASRRRESGTRSVVMCGPAIHYSNTGDRLLPKTLGEIVRQDLGTERVTYASVAVDPRVNAEAPWMEVVSPRTQPLKLLWRTFRADAFIIGGAIPFHDHRLTMLKQAVLAWVNRIGGGRVVVNAVGVQPLNDPVCRFLFRVTHRAAPWFTVRDDVAAQNATEMGVDAPPRSPDPGTISNAASAERIAEIFRSEGVPDDRTIIGVAPHMFVNGQRYRHPGYVDFRNEYEEYADDELDAYFEGMAKAADRLTELGHLVFIPLCTAMPPGDDRVAANWIQERMQRSDRTSSIEGEYTVDEVTALLRSCKVLLASRLHGYALAVGGGVPTMAIEFHPKIRGLAEDLALEDWVFPMSPIPADDIFRTAQGMLKNLEEARTRVLNGATASSHRARADFLEGVTGRRYAV